MTLNQRLDRACVLLAAKEPWFAPNFEAARNLLHTATLCADVVKYPHGVVCGPEGCSCNNPACLHRVGWRIYCGE